MFIKRVIRALLLDPELYEEVEQDKSAIWQAVVVVFLASLARGIYTYKTGDYRGLILGTITSFVLWILLAFLIYIIGTKLFPESETRTDQGELMRVLGFASAPGIFRVFAVVHWLTPYVLLFVWLWTLVAMIIGVRQALDYKSTWRAVGVCLIGFVVYFVIFFLIFWIFGIKPPVETGA